MTHCMIRPTLAAAALTLAMAAPSAVLAYGNSDAIKDCEKRLKDEYGLKDFRDQSATKVPGGDHWYDVTGKTKIDDEKYDFACEVRERHVTKLTYNGPEPEGLGTAEKLAIGAAAAVAAGAVASSMAKEKLPEATSAGLTACRDAVMKETAYRDLPESAFKVAAKMSEDANVEWHVETDSMKDWGTCNVSAENQVLAVKTMKHEKK